MAKWNIVPTPEYENDLSKYLKKKPAELRAVLANLQRLLEVLEVVDGPAQVSCRFFKSEGDGLFRISELGGGKSLQPTRLYLTCALKHQKLVLLRLLAKGPKKKQSQQIQNLKRTTTEKN